MQLCYKTILRLIVTIIQISYSRGVDTQASGATQSIIILGNLHHSKVKPQSKNTQLYTPYLTIINSQIFMTSAVLLPEFQLGLYVKSSISKNFSNQVLGEYNEIHKFLPVERNLALIEVQLLVVENLKILSGAQKTEVVFSWQDRLEQCPQAHC